MLLKTHGAIYTYLHGGRVWKLLEMSTHLYSRLGDLGIVWGILEFFRVILYITLYIDLCWSF